MGRTTRYRCKIKNNVFSSKSGIVRYLVTRFHFCSIHSIHFRETLKRGRNFFSWKRVFHVGNVIFFFFFLFWYSRKFVNSVGRKFEKKRTRYEIKRKETAIVRTGCSIFFSSLSFPFLSFFYCSISLPEISKISAAKRWTSWKCKLIYCDIRYRRRNVEY